jgi:hypothetical protein
MELMLRAGRIIHETKYKLVIYRPMSQNFIVMNKVSKKIELIATTRNGAIAFAENKPLF